MERCDVMNMDLLENNCILIVPNNLKNNLLKDISHSSKLLNVKFMSREEFIINNTFDYDERAVLYLMDKYDYDSDVAKIKLANMYYVDKSDYSSIVLSELSSLKEELLKEKLLTIDTIFSKAIEKRKIYVYGYFYIDNLFKKYLSKYDYEVLKNESKEKKNNVVFRANTLEEEVEFVFNKIGDLIDKGITINDIKIVNYSDKYENVFKKLAKLYGLPIEDRGYSIYGTEIVKDYLDKLLKSESIEDAINFIKNKYTSEDDFKVVGSILNISNKYNDLKYSFKSVYALIKNDLQKSRVIINDYVNKLSFGDMNPLLYNDNNYIFLIGFNQNELPKLYKDEDYISDLDKRFVDLEDTNMKNKLSKDEVLYFINNTANLNMSYSLKHLQNDYYESNLISENNFVVKDIASSDNVYSSSYAKMKLTKYLDDFIKYGTINPLLNKYYNSYKIDYLTYDNKFSGITSYKLMNKLDNKLLLSYSSINTYNKCHFRYYLDNILKINKYEETFPIKVGNLFHYLLSICFRDDFDFDREWDKYVKNLTLDEKENVLLLKLKDELLLIIDFVKNLHKETYLTDSLMEYKIYVKKDRNIKVDFMGIIDKCMYREKDGETLVSIIDYKTGNPTTSLYNVAYGIDMQLPIYWYLVKRGNLFENPKFVGFYLEKILHGELKRDSKKNYHDLKMNNLKLVGYSTSDKSRIEKFDPTYEDSSFISGMRVKNDGEFYNYTKTLDDDVLDLLIDYIDKIIDEDISSIIEGDFSINPKQIGIELVGCNYCKYSDICYRKNEDIVKVKEYKDLSFLGGDIDA